MESHLISPTGIAQWTDWSRHVESLHGLSCEVLCRDGKRPLWVCGRMNAQLDGKLVCVENPTFDGRWLSALFAACWKQPECEIKNLDELVSAILYLLGSTIASTRTIAPEQM